MILVKNEEITSVSANREMRFFIVALHPCIPLKLVDKVTTNKITLLRKSLMLVVLTKATVKKFAPSSRFA